MPKQNEPLKRVTIHDLAREVGLSTSTVSAALNGTGKLRQETRDMVQQAAGRLGYKSSRAAMAFRLGRSGIIALALPTADGGAVPMLDLDFYMGFARVAATMALEAGYALTLTPPSLRGEEEWRLLDADGVVLCDPLRNDARLTALERLGTPTVTVERDAGRPDWRAAVASDHAANMDLLLGHLYDQGARRIALIGAATSWAWAEESTAAYRAWVGARGLPEILRLVPLDQNHSAPHAAALELLRAEAPPDAIIAIAEQYREGVLQACREEGLRIPEDLMLAMGIDSPGCERIEPALTALDLQPEEQARLAMAMLLRLLNGEPVEGPLQSEAVLRLRTSTGRLGPEAQ